MHTLLAQALQMARQIKLDGNSICSAESNRFACRIDLNRLFPTLVYAVIYVKVTQVKCGLCTFGTKRTHRAIGI